MNSQVVTQYLGKWHFPSVRRDCVVMGFDDNKTKTQKNSWDPLLSFQRKAAFINISLNATGILQNSQIVISTNVMTKLQII